ncbi:rod shape-determining protein MreC [Psittacicella hinzii]|uniref:Cell shape-determining protein MreC n=1 Tax=Psittacicella hinzii TaxID=2028575 RepID=A0A3A1YKT9_9GAMM|nr:rod shape-determining protein MreC [Psittacicella hinzii]RIY37829.1 rod shape-determining protein MreC [Psittacicella hinzii]
MICMLIAVTLFVLSVTKQIEPMRTALDNATNRIFIFNYGTKQIVNHITPNFKDVGSLTTAYEDLQKQVTELKFQLENVKVLQAENAELKALLRIPDSLVAKTQIVNIINTEQGAKNNLIFIDKGAHDGLFYGQNIFDAYGLIGQIVSISDNQSRVLLITDVNSYVPVFNISNQEQYLVHGTNSIDLSLDYISSKSTVKPGDVLYTSGLAKRYIKNYAVAVVTEVTRDSHGNVISAKARPVAHLNSLRYMVAVWPYCNIMPTYTASQNLVFNRNYTKNLIGNKLEQRTTNKNNYLTYTYQGVDPDSLSVGVLLNKSQVITPLVDLDYGRNVNLETQNCYVINPQGSLQLVNEENNE